MQFRTYSSACRSMAGLSRHAALAWCAAATLAGGWNGIASADDEPVGHVYEDLCGDAVIRRTDAGVDGLLAGSESTPPDMVRVEMVGWQPVSPSQPFDGCRVRARTTGIVRIDMVFSGLVSPPGRVDPTGWRHAPAPFGGTPVFGYLDINVDRDRDTGGELGAPARWRVLGACARFGFLPTGPISARCANSSAELDEDFATMPQFERSGADFTFSLCGCEDPIVLSADGDGDMIFDAGETWLLSGRYFPRAGGYRSVSGVFGGSNFGEYDPRITLRVSHSTTANETTFSIVYPLTPEGAAYLTEQPEQPVDQMIGLGSHFSVQEALQDLVWSAQSVNSLPASDPARVLIERWKNKLAARQLDPVEWRAIALFGMAYAQPEPSRFAWTDVGFVMNPKGDLDDDGKIGDEDHKLFLERAAKLDGCSHGVPACLHAGVPIENFGPSFDLIDFNADGRVDLADLAVVGPVCRADFNGANGATVQDIFDYLTAWLGGSSTADFNGVNGVTVQDIFDFLTEWLAGC